MKKNLRVIVLALVFLGMTLTKVGAVVLTPSSGTYNPNLQITVALTASPPGASETVLQLRLTSTNITIINFVPAGGWTTTTGDCGSGAYFNTTHVCATFTSSSPIVNGQAVGTLTIKMGVAGTGTIVRDTNNSYSDGTVQGTVTQPGTAASYVISGNPVSYLPNTSVGDPINNVMILVISSAFIIIGIKLLADRNEKK